MGRSKKKQQRGKTAIVEVLGEEAEVEYKMSFATVEIKDLESETSDDEVRNAVVKASGTAPSRIKLLPSWGGNKMAVVRIRQRNATKLIKAGRLIVGLVRCRVKLRQTTVRCYRCHGFGHFKSACRGKDRSDLCMNDVGKVLEFLLASRLEAHISCRGGLASNQYGFRKNLSTDDAVRKLNSTINTEINNGNFCLAVGIDIKNAFNSVGWSDVMASLSSWDVPRYLRNIFGSYFSHRSGTVESLSSPGGEMDVVITGGVSQGSVVGPLLWNMTYNTVLGETLPVGVTMLGFADDTLVVVAAKTISDLEELANKILDQIAGKINQLGLDIAAEKTEAVLFTNRYKYTIPRVRICGTYITLADQMTYLGIVIDRSCLFKAHIRKTTEKADRISAQLARLMPNIGGPREHTPTTSVRRALGPLVWGTNLGGNTEIRAK